MCHEVVTYQCSMPMTWNVVRTRVRLLLVVCRKDGAYSIGHTRAYKPRMQRGQSMVISALSVDLSRKSHHLVRVTGYGLTNLNAHRKPRQRLISLANPTLIGITSFVKLTFTIT